MYAPMRLNKAAIKFLKYSLSFNRIRESGMVQTGDKKNKSITLTSSPLITANTYEILVIPPNKA